MEVPVEVHRYTLVTSIVESMTWRRKWQQLQDDDGAGKRREEVLDDIGEELYLVY